ncbi:hypothetical protein DFJ74DRAFT_40256 [Hyaloraphidium curvatum]|nr:hypothetical protein DFJ74DRAFT_40256 [Hyaloraphidium curvatum]
MSVISSTWVFRTDYGFAARQFAVGFASWVLLFTQITLVHPSISTFRRALEPLGASHGDVPRTLDAYPLAGLARWRALLDDSSNGNPSKLLSHDPLDDLCPCSLSRCAGGLVKGIAILRIVEAAVKIALLGTFCVFTFWTPYITLASSFWGTTWTAVLGSLNAVALALYAFPNSICRFTASTTALRLSERVAHRAMKLALDDLLARLTTGASRPEASVAGEPYAELHTVFTAIWRTRISSFHFSRLQVLSAGLAALLSVVNMIVGSCIPSMFLGYILYAILAQVLFDLLALAASNAQVTSIRDLYLEAQREIRELPLPPDPQRAADLRRHDAVGWGSLYRWTLCARAGEDAVRGGMWYRCII